MTTLKVLIIINLFVFACSFVLGFINAWIHDTEYRYWWNKNSGSIARCSSFIDLNKMGFSEISRWNYWRRKIAFVSWLPVLPTEGNLLEKEIYLRGTKINIGKWVPSSSYYNGQPFGQESKWTHPLIKVWHWLGLRSSFHDSRLNLPRLTR